MGPNISRLIPISITVAMLLSACGGGDDGGAESSAPASGSQDSETPGDDAGGDFDRSQLPDGFPEKLIPDTFDFGNVTDLDDFVLVGFTSNVPVDDTVERYRSILGEPRTNVEGDPGERNVIWAESEGWVVSVLGSPDESIISITDLPEE